MLHFTVISSIARYNMQEMYMSCIWLILDLLVVEHDGFTTAEAQATCIASNDVIKQLGSILVFGATQC